MKDANVHDLAERLNALTRREREVLALVGQGYSLPDIARKLYRSLKTIESHRLSLGRKLEVSNRVELARIAIQSGLAPLPGRAESSEAQSSEVRQRVADRDEAWQILRAIDAHVAFEDGPGRVLPSLVGALQKHLQVDAAAIVRLDAHGAGRVVAQAVRREPALPDAVPVDGPPLSDVVEERRVEIDPIPEPYRRHPLLAQRDAAALYGIRLDTHHEQPIGALVVAASESIARELEIELILRTVASRAAAELDDLLYLESARTLARLLSPDGEGNGDGQSTPDTDDPEFHGVAGSLHAGLAAIDRDRRLVYVNPVLCRWLDRDADDLLGEDVATIQTHEHAAWFREVQPLREKGELKRYQLHLVDRHGKPIPTVAYPAAIYDAGGHFCGSFGLLVRL